MIQQMTLPGLSVERTGIRCSGEMAPAEREQVLQLAMHMYAASNWVLGDAINMQPDPNWEGIAQELGRTVNDLKAIAQVCYVIPIGRRRAGLSFTHHREVALASLSNDTRDRLLRTAEEQQLNAAKLRKLIMIEHSAGPQLLEDHEFCDLCNTDTGVDYPNRVEVTRLSAWASRAEPSRLTNAQKKQLLDDCKTFLTFLRKCAP